MHELSLMRGLLRKIETIARDEKALKITGVNVTLGPLSHISPDHFREHFLLASSGTLAEGASLDIQILTHPEAPEEQEICLKSVELEIP
ncbi:MAG: hydrogenase maturation nickel metallochaperone HypA [Armatimonadetes bacterium]|nr:hydrogenase maturation nickel metallochaperone HypA [Armatimonadota bacterium]